MPTSDEEHEDRIDALERAMSEHDLRIRRLEESMSVLKVDVVEIRATLRTLATKDDIITAMQQAFNAVPFKQSVLWSAISALAGVAAAVLAMHGLHG